MNLQNCKKIVSVFVIAFGIILFPKVSFALSFDYDGYSYNVPEITDNWYIMYVDANGENMPYNYLVYSKYIDSTVKVINDRTYTGINRPNGGVYVCWFADGVLTQGNSNITYSYNTALFDSLYTNIPSGNFYMSVQNKIKGTVPIDIPKHYITILGSFSNSSVNFNNGDKITSDIIVTANNNYYFTSVQNGFALSDNDTIATYDVSELTGNFNLVATDFTTKLIGSDDPPIEPPDDPPTDEPIIIGDIEFTDSTPVGNWFGGLFSSAIDLFESAIPYILGVFGIYFAINWFIALIKKS